MDKEELKSKKRDFRYQEETQEEPKKVVKKNEPPMGYIKVKLDSLGKLFAPKELHFRNYSVSELLKLSEAGMNDKNYLSALLDVLNDMVWENFDCGLLHEKELEEVLLSIFGAFWSKSISGMRYRVIEDEKDPKYNDPENIKEATFSLECIKTKPLEHDVKPTANITMPDGSSAKYKILTVGDTVEAWKFIEDLYFEDDRKWDNFKFEYEQWKAHLNSDSLVKFDIDHNKRKQYEAHETKKALDFISACEASMLVSYGKKVPQTIAEKFKMCKNEVGGHFYKAFSKKLAEYFDYGIDPNITFMSIDLEKEITRRFLFRAMDFIPSMDEKDTPDFDFSFSD